MRTGRQEGLSLDPGGLMPGRGSRGGLCSRGRLEWSLGGCGGVRYKLGWGLCGAESEEAQAGGVQGWSSLAADLRPG